MRPIALSCPTPARVLLRALTIIGLLLAGSIVPVSAHAAVTSMAAEADAYVNEWSPDQNHGGSSRLVAKSSPGAEFYVSFTVPTAPSGQQWGAAKLVLKRLSPGVASTLTARRTTSSWAEASVVWNQRPTTAANSVSVADNGTSATVVFDVQSLITGGVNSFAVRSTATTSLLFGSRENSDYAPELQLTAVASTPPTCTTSRRGILCSGAYVGATVGSNTDPATFESSVGRTLGLRRTFWSHSQVSSAIQTAAADVAKGRLPWISFSLPYSWSDMAIGKGDAWARDIATRLTTVNGPVWVAFHHEPEKDGVESQWVAVQRRLSPIVRSIAPNVAYTIILTGWHELYDPNYNLEMMWPGDGLIDAVGFDVYLSYGLVKNGTRITKFTDLDTAYFKPLGEWAAKHKVAWGLAETGLTDEASEVDPTWMPDIVTAMKARGGSAWTYFNTKLNSEGSWVITTTNKTRQFSEALKGTARIP